MWRYYLLHTETFALGDSWCLYIYDSNVKVNKCTLTVQSCQFLDGGLYTCLVIKEYRLLPTTILSIVLS